jgi:hypothetical protein
MPFPADAGGAMIAPALHSLEQEYALYIEREIEDYKMRVPRAHLFALADAARQAMVDAPQLVLDEILLRDAVDHEISRRLRLPSFRTWQRKYLRALEELRRPERWGLAAGEPLVQALPSVAHTHALVADQRPEQSALFLAANGCTVTTLTQEEDVLERVLQAAQDVGLDARVTGVVADLGGWWPTEYLTTVVCSPAAFGHLSPARRAEVIATLQSATTDGGVHLVETIVAGRKALTVKELRERYRGWDCEVVADEARGTRTFVARKERS